MTVPKINSAHGSDTRNILNRAIDSINVQGKSIQDLVAEGQLTPTQYATLIKSINDLSEKSEVRENTKTRPINVAEMDTETKKLFTGGAVAVVGENAVGRENIKPKAVAAEKTNFIANGKNKFDGNYVVGSMIVTFPDLSTMDFGPSSGAGRLAIIPIEPNETYTVSVPGDHDRFRVGVHNSYPIISETRQLVDTPIFAQDTASKHTFTNDGNGKYLLVVVSNSSQEPSMQVEKGSEATTYEPYSYKFTNMASESVKEGNLTTDLKVKINNAANSYSALKDVLVNANKFDGNYEYGSIVTHGDDPIGEIGELATGKIAFVKVEKDTDYSVKVIGNADRFKIAGYTGEEKPPYRASLEIIFFNDDLQNKQRSFNSGNYNWVIVYVSATNQTPHLNFNTGGIVDTTIPYDEARIELKAENLPGDFDVEQQTRQFLLLDEISGIYDRPDDLESVASGQPIDLITSSHTIIYDIYDDLVTNFPEYVSRVLLGNDSSGLPIYQYNFTPETPIHNNDANFDYKKIKISVTSAIHGYEQLSAWATAQFFKDLCYNHASKEQLEFMRWNVDFVVIPVCNPWGYDNNDRKNFNGVDLNRNFPSDAWVSGDPTSDTYGGTAPASEIETQLIMQFLQENDDVIYHIDHHNIAGGYPLVYSRNEYTTNLTLNTFRTLTRKWRKDYPTSPTNTMFGYVNSTSPTVPSSAMNGYVNTISLGTTLESTWMMPFASAKYDKITVECATDLFGNFVTAILKSVT